MVGCSGCTWHTTGSFSRRSSSCIQHWRTGCAHSMAHPWVGLLSWVGSSWLWPSWFSWPSSAGSSWPCGSSWAWPSLAWTSCPSGPSWAWSSWAWWSSSSGPSWAWSSWSWWLALAWLTTVVLVLVLGGFSWALDGLNKIYNLYICFGVWKHFVLM